MSNEVRVELKGLEELRAKMKALSGPKARKAFRTALRRSAKKVADQVKQNARGLDDPETGRSIADNVAVRPSSRYEKKTGDLMMRVGILGGAVLPKGDPDLGKKGPTPHWRLLEFGTSRMQAKPFFRPAIDAKVPDVLNTFVEEVDKAVEKALNSPNSRG